MNRLPRWESHLHAYLAAQAAASFTFGTCDCALFCAGAVEAVTGEDPAAIFRGKYSTAAGSARALKRYGAGTLESTVDAIFPAISPAFAQRGDIVMHGEALGVCVGKDALFVGQEDDREGLVRVARDQWSKAWKVG